MSRNHKKGNKQQKHRKTESDDTYNYYKRIEEVLLLSGDKDGKDLNDDFIDNVFSQLAEDAAKVCQSPGISPVIEKLVIKGTAAHILSLIKVFSKDWSNFCKHQCSSHILQKIIMVIPKFIKEKLTSFDFESEVEEGTEEPVEESLIRTILELLNFMSENIEDCVKNVYLSHIFRAILQVIGGTCVGEKVLKSHTSMNYGKKFRRDNQEDDEFSKPVTFADYDVPVYLRNYLKKFYKQIFELENFGVYLTNANGSPVIQTLLLVLHKVDLDLCQKVIHKVIKASRIEDTGDSVNIPPVACDMVGSFLVELIVSLSSEKIFQELYSKLFKGKLLQFATHPCANFVLQKIIKTCPDKEMFSSMLEELNDAVEEILKVKHLGVMVAMAATCEKLKSGQSQFLQMIMKCFQCQETERREKLVQVIASLTTYEQFMQGGEPLLKKVSYHGSQLLQHMLQFADTFHLANSLVHMKPVELVTLSCDPCGSHVIDATFKGPSCGQKTKDMLLNKLKDHFVTLACDKNGSRALESIWRNASLKQKELIATGLCSQEDRIRHDKIGFHIHRNFALFHFNKRRKEWHSMQQSGQRKRKMFQDVLKKDESSKKKKKNMNKKPRRKDTHV